mmetsp:Transcript_40070/g.115543  ORF Transcript_40070/g.115543 Transcript_40070/m.115543 type:complete len:330 (-) Transcript_40070:69-1058(-)
MTAMARSATPSEASSGARRESPARRARAFSRAPIAPAGPTVVRARRLSTANLGSTVGRSGRCGRHKIVISATHCVSRPRLASWPKRCHVLREQSAAPATATARAWLGAISSARAQHSWATSATWLPAFQASTTSVRPPAARSRSRTSGRAAQQRRTAWMPFVAACQRRAGSLPPIPLSTARKRCKMSRSRHALASAAFLHSSCGCRSSEVSMAQAPAALEERRVPMEAFVHAVAKSAAASWHRSGFSASKAALQTWATSSSTPAPTFRTSATRFATASMAGGRGARRWSTARAPLPELHSADGGGEAAGARGDGEGLGPLAANALQLRA